MAVEARIASSVYSPQAATIIGIEEMSDTERWFKLRLDSRQPLGHESGQFVELSIFGYGEAPVSISSPPHQTDSFEICVRKTGCVTDALHRLSIGSRVGIRGPFGSVFPVEKFYGKNMLFVAGGLGIIPLRSLIKNVLHQRNRFKSVIILHGAKRSEELLFATECNDWQQQADVDYQVTVDRPSPGWDGHVGVITTLIPPLQFDPTETIAAIVGPPIMYRFVILDLLARGMGEHDIWLSLERRMKCGIGKCGHCQINGRYVCQEGPVFNYNDVRYLPEAL